MIAACWIGKKPKLAYAEKKEFDQIEAKISLHEEEVQKLNRQLEDPLIAQNPSRLQEICTAIGCIETKIEQLYLRFEELDKKLY